MKFDKNLVSTILEHEFCQEIFEYAADSVMELGGEDLDSIFGQIVDYALLDTIEGVTLNNIEQETDEGECIRISGDMNIEMTLMGYVHFGGEDNYVGNVQECMDFSFSFWHEDGKNYKFQMERDWCRNLVN